ncbi:S41 family peptidase [Streptomyces prasinus]
MQETSLRRNAIDWSRVRDEAFDAAANAHAPSDTYRAISQAVGSLGDGHSYFYTPEQVDEISAAAGGVAGQGIEGRRLVDGLGYIALPGVQGDAKALAVYVDRGRAEIAAADRGGACGWVVDLRRNRGGNMWPMLTVLGPILGEGEAGAFVDADGQATSFVIRDGAPRRGNDTWPWTPPSRVARQNPPPVAVLTDGRTASSGEATAVEFRGRPSTRTFGMPTAGIPTGIAPRTLTDGAVLGITESEIADRTGRTYQGPLQPDEEILTRAKDFGTDTDRALSAASEWLAGLGCPK